jgi:NADPH:quinone reductase-like Zn-dependent oxidoreductase
MQAIGFHQYGSVEVLEMLTLPIPTPQPHEILVKVRASSVNPKDTFIRKGRFRAFSGTRFPQFLGYDVAGEVAAVGADVHDFQVGAAVYAMLEGFRGGGWSEYVALPSNWAALKPAELSFTEAAALPLVGLTALQALRDDGKLHSGQRVFINGASGGVGTVAIQIAKALGAHVTASCSERSAALVQMLGADATFDYAHSDIRQLRGFDVFFDVFGNYSFSKVRPLLRAGGHYVTTVPKIRNFFAQWRSRWWGQHKAAVIVVKSHRADLELLSNWVTAGKLRPIIEKTYPLSEIQAANQRVETKRTKGKVVIRIGD